MEVRQKAHPLLVTFLRVQRKYGKAYCWPSQVKILDLLDRMQGIKKSRGTLNRWLRVAEDSGYLKRRRRIKRHPVHGITFKSTLYKITVKGLRLLSAFGVEVKKELALFNAWLKEVSPKPEKEGVHQGMTPDPSKRIRLILDKLGGSFSP